MKETLIIIINYNSAIHTIECVESLTKQTLKEFDIFIIDNSSEKEDVLQLEKISKEKAIVYLSKENLGFAGGNNIGIRYALENNYSSVLILNNDTIVPENFIEKIQNCSKKNINMVISPQIREYSNPQYISYAGGDIAYYKGAVNIYGVGKKVEKNDIRKLITFAHGCCMYIPIDIIKKVGLMPEEYFLYYEDTAYSAEIQKHGFQILYAGDIFILHKECASTTKYSDNYQYYFVRNRLMFLKKYVPLGIKFIAYPYTYAFILKKLFRKLFKWSNVKEGLRDFYNGYVGKRRN